MSYSDYDPAALAEALVESERAGMDTLLSDKSDKYSTLVSGYSSLESLLSDFQDTLDSYTDEDSDLALSAQTCTTSDSDYFTVTSDGSASASSYSIFVEQLAQSYQSVMSFDSEDWALPTDGTLTFTVDGEEMTIDLSTLDSDATLDDLVSAINSNDDNPGVQASLIQSGDSVMLMLSSEETGEDYAVTTSYTAGTASTATTELTDALSNMTVLSEAQDAIIKLGSSSNAISITSSSNTMEDVIDGLTITLTDAQESTDSPITLNVEADDDTVETNLQTLVDTFNTLVSSLTDLYDGGNLDGDSTVRGLISSLKNTLRSSLPDGYSLSDIGLEFTSSGTLEIDSDALESALAANPDILTSVFSDDGGVFDAFQDLLDPYTETAGILSSMEDSAQDSLDRVTDRQDAWDTKMTNLYNTYLEDFTQMQITLAELESSMSILST
nr:flagellar filament capping protein FliD [uncultured Tolumonas sp.]